MTLDIRASTTVSCQRPAHSSVSSECALCSCPHVFEQCLMLKKFVRAAQCRQSVEVGHELAIKYNDRSPLENMPGPNPFKMFQLQIPLDRLQSALQGTVRCCINFWRNQRLSCLVRSLMTTTKRPLLSLQDCVPEAAQNVTSGTPHLRRDHLAYGHGMWGVPDLRICLPRSFIHCIEHVFAMLS